MQKVSRNCRYVGVDGRSSANFRLIGPSNGTKIDGTHLTTTVFVFHGRVKFLWIFLEQNVCNLSPAGSPFLLYSCIVKFQAVQGPRRKTKKRKKKRRVLAIANFCQEQRNQRWLRVLLFSKKGRIGGFTSKLWRLRSCNICVVLRF